MKNNYQTKHMGVMKAHYASCHCASTAKPTEPFIYGELMWIVYVESSYRNTCERQ